MGYFESGAQPSPLFLAPGLLALSPKFDMRARVWYLESMTQTEKDAATGTLLREQKEAKRDLALLESEARRLGEGLREIGCTLINTPELVTIDQQPVVGIDAVARQDFNSSTVDAQRIAKLTDEIRRTRERLDWFGSKVREAGFDD